MRLGERKNIIARALNDNNQIEIERTPIYGGQAYKVTNFSDVLKAIVALADQEWNDQDETKIEELIEKYGTQKKEAQLEAAEFNALNGYVSTLNQKLPLFFSILETMVDEQDEKTINIKLPSQEGKSLGDLSKLHEELDKELKKFQVDGGFEFKGFDKGSDWLVIIPVGIFTYRFFMACLKLSQEYFKTQSEYFKSKEAEISYKARLKQSEEEESDAGFKKFQKEWMEIFIEEGVKAIVAKINETNGDTVPSLTAKLIKATKGLIKLLDDNLEFHPSLNPPEYIEDTDEGIAIDYEKLQELTATPAEEAPKELEGAEDDNEESND